MSGFQVAYEQYDKRKQKYNCIRTREDKDGK